VVHRATDPHPGQRSAAQAEQGEVGDAGTHVVLADGEDDREGADRREEGVGRRHGEQHEPGRSVTDQVAEHAAHRELGGRAPGRLTLGVGLAQQPPRQQQPGQHQQPESPAPAEQRHGDGAYGHAGCRAEELPALDAAEEGPSAPRCDGVAGERGKRGADGGRDHPQHHPRAEQHREARRRTGREHGQ